jgi:hypothetical protein
MTVAQRDYINWLAGTVRENCKLSVPVDVEKAVERLGGTIAIVNSADFEAKIEKAPPGFRISICPAKGSSAERKRFTMAHELGHLFIHMGYIVDHEKWAAIVDYTDSVYFRYGFSVEEGEADEFAAAFLMPEIEFAITAKRHFQDGHYNMAAIARHFRVSVPAATTRGRLLGILSWE